MKAGRYPAPFLFRPAGALGSRKTKRAETRSASFTRCRGIRQIDKRVCQPGSLLAQIKVGTEIFLVSIPTSEFIVHWTYLSLFCFIYIQFSFLTGPSSSFSFFHFHIDYRISLIGYFLVIPFKDRRITIFSSLPVLSSFTLLQSPLVFY